MLWGSFFVYGRPGVPPPHVAKTVVSPLNHHGVRVSVFKYFHRFLMNYHWLTLRSNPAGMASLALHQWHTEPLLVLVCDCHPDGDTPCPHGRLSILSNSTLHGISLHLVFSSLFHFESQCFTRIGPLSLEESHSVLWFIAWSGYLMDLEESQDLEHRFLIIFGAMTSQFPVLDAVVNKPFKMFITIIQGGQNIHLWDRIITQQRGLYENSHLWPGIRFPVWATKVSSKSKKSGNLDPGETDAL